MKPASIRRINVFEDGRGWEIRTVNKAAADNLPLKRREHPNGYILVIPDCRDGQLSVHDHEVLGAGVRLADELNAALVAIAPCAPDLLGDAGTELVIEADIGINDDTYLPETRLKTILLATERLKPLHILLPDTPLGGGDTGRRLAAHLGEYPACGVIALYGKNVWRHASSAAVEQRFEIPRILMIAEGAVSPENAQRHEATPLAFSFASSSESFENSGSNSLELSEMPISEADFIIAAGTGVTDWQSFHELASRLGAVEGATRAVCDQGRMPRARQIGASGSLVNPTCYMALGISGATQHLQGITECKYVIAVNIDLYAGMMRRADLAIVADVQQVMPALLRKLDARR